MSYTATLREFILLGRLGFLEFGLSQKAVLEQCGIPKKLIPGRVDGEVLKIPYKRSHYWQYKTFTVYWDMSNLTLNGIQLYFKKKEKLPDWIKPAGYFPPEPVTIDEFETFLRAEAIPYKKDTLKKVSIEHLLIDPGTLIFFAIEKDGRSMLRYIRAALYPPYQNLMETT